MIKRGTEKYDINGNMTYYETDDGKFRRFVYDEEHRLIYYNEDDKYEEWRVCTDDGDFVHLKNNRGNERYIRDHKGEHISVDISKEEFDEKKFQEDSNPDRFRFELMEI